MQPCKASGEGTQERLKTLNWHKVLMSPVFPMGQAEEGALVTDRGPESSSVPTPMTPSLPMLQN